ncbi:polyamine aminopropyltransferase [Telmatospirillum sp. J64-1]|uniref:polyamine aminopropyltransferase n=1 Tax=Telmatospirillum sp. J64-1 TaxID=2502183 RepID=UPI00115D76E3|nr:polyamine aminopropyltransferase [Telmatospirillum sp. J64-1]
MSWFNETLYPSWRQSFQIAKTLYEDKSEFQELVIFEAPGFGRVLTLDGVVQVTEGDEYVYHEMLAHVPMLAHGAVREVLIIGGGDGGMLREVLKHPVTRATMVEIDRSVIDLCTQYMPSISDGAFEDPRAEIVIADGLKYVAETDRRFDLIIVDSTDPIGPGEVLFSEAFYADCRARLNPGGIIVTQNGVPFLQAEELKSSYAKFRRLFQDPGFFVAAVPTYVGGFMTLGWGSDEASHRQHSVEEIRRRFEARPFKTRYYNPEIHVASFALPQFVRDMMKEA